MPHVAPPLLLLLALVASAHAASSGSYRFPSGYVVEHADVPYACRARGAVHRTGAAACPRRGTRFAACGVYKGRAACGSFCYRLLLTRGFDLRKCAARPWATGFFVLYARCLYGCRLAKRAIRRASRARRAPVHALVRVARARRGGVSVQFLAFRPTRLVRPRALCKRNPACSSRRGRGRGRACAPFLCRRNPKIRIAKRAQPKVNCWYCRWKRAFCGRRCPRRRPRWSFEI